VVDLPGGGTIPESSVDDERSGDEAGEWPSGLVAVVGTTWLPNPAWPVRPIDLGIFPWSFGSGADLWSPESAPAVFDLPNVPSPTAPSDENTARRCGVAVRRRSLTFAGVIALAAAARDVG